MKLFENFRIGSAGKFGDSGEPVDRQKIFSGDFGEDTLADGISGKGFVCVAFVFPKIQMESFCVGEELFFFYGKERSNDSIFAAGLYALESFDSRSAQNPHQERFRLVVCVMGGEDELGLNFWKECDFVQGLVAGDSGVLFDRTVRFQEISVKMPDEKRNV